MTVITLFLGNKSHQFIFQKTNIIIRYLSLYLEYTFDPHFTRNAKFPSNECKSHYGARDEFMEEYLPCSLNFI